MRHMIYADPIIQAAMTEDDQRILKSFEKIMQSPNGYTRCCTIAKVVTELMIVCEYPSDVIEKFVWTMADCLNGL